ncbi:hypothetical protein LSAT2_016928 [Lamellibrachia satsuma]|nr:hypothetical protein LSAT2_016928 [Lamellibrachia satsuma]
MTSSRLTFGYVGCLDESTPPDDVHHNVTPLCCVDSRHKCCFIEGYDINTMEEERILSAETPATFLPQNVTTDSYRSASAMQQPLDGLLLTLFLVICCACASLCLTSLLRLRRRAFFKELAHVGMTTAASMTTVVVHPVIGEVTARLTPAVSSLSHIDRTAGGDYIDDIKPNLDVKYKPDKCVSPMKEVVTLEAATRLTACKIIPRRLVRRLIKQNACMRVRNYRDRQRIVKFEKEIKLKSSRNMALFMCVKEEMAKVMNLDQQLFKLDSDNTTLADKLETLKKNCRHQKTFHHPSIKDGIERHKTRTTSRGGGAWRKD